MDGFINLFSKLHPLQKWVKKPLFLNSYQTKQKTNKQKKAFLSHGAIQINTAPQGFRQWVYGSFQTWLQYLEIYVQKLEQFNAKTKSVL